MDRAWYLGDEFPQNYLQVEYLGEMPANLERPQRQALDLLIHIWVKDASEKSVDEKMTAYYLEAEQAGKDVFRFRPQKMSYEPMYRQTFAEFLCPATAGRGTVTAPPMTRAVPAKRSARSESGERARVRTRRSRCSGGSTRNASPGSKRDRSPKDEFYD